MKRAPGLTRIQVKVVEIIPSNASARCIEVSGGKSIEVRLLPMRAGRVPRVGEDWILDRDYDAWTFAALLNSPTVFPPSTYVGTVAPANPQPGDRWVPTPAKVWNGTAWVAE